MRVSAKYGVRVLLLLAWPVVLARSAQAVIGFCDAAMTAPLGEDALAAVTTGAMNTFALAILPMGIVFIVQSFAAQLKGAGQLGAARRYAWYGLILAALTGALSLAGIPATRGLLGLLPFEAGVQALMADYMEIRLLSLAGIVATEALGNWYGGLGNTRLHMGAALLQMALNVLLNWVLIFGNLGAPALGVEGAAWASVIATWGGAAALGLLFLARYGYERDGGPLGLKLAEFIRMLRFGVPNGLNWFLEFAAFWLFINLVVSQLGTLVLAVMNVVIQINSVSFMPAFGVSSAGAILTGQAIGAGDHDEVPRLLQRTVTVTALWQGSVGLVYLAIPGALIAMFEPPTGAAARFLEIGVVLLPLSAAWQLFDAVAISVGEALRAAGDTAWALWARIVIAWILFVPSSVVFVLWLEGGYVAAILCIVAYIGALGVTLLWRFRTGAWRTIELTGTTG